MLSPVMAMPRFLHSVTNVSEIDNLNPSMLMHQSSNLTSQITIPADTDTDSKTYMVIKHGEKVCNMMTTNKTVSNTRIKCNALCKMICAGRCVSHGTSVILIETQLSLSSPESNDKVQTLSWSAQTSDLTPPNPPPIWTNLT